MRRREFITGLAGGLVAALAAWPSAIVARDADNARISRAFENIKRDYGKLPHPSEAARAEFITRLARLREQAVRRNRGEWTAIDAEIKQHPAPPDADGKILTALRVGDWESPRHDYRYRPDGTWIMLPDEEGATNGTWRIAGISILTAPRWRRRKSSIIRLSCSTSAISYSWTMKLSFMKRGKSSAAVEDHAK
jgi:hypothetical protein